MIATDARDKFHLPRNVIALGLVSLFTDVSSEMLYPIIPLFLTATLGAPMGAVGLVEGVAEAMGYLLRGLSGYLSDRFHRRKIFVVLGYLTSGVAKPLTALAGSWVFVLATRLLDRLGKSVRTAPRDALIAAQVGPSNRGYAFGLHRAMDTAGAVVGAALALALVWWWGVSFRSMFVLACFPAAVGVLIAWATVKEVQDAKPAGEGEDLGAWRGRIGWLNAPLMKFYIVTGVFALANSSNVFLILRAKNIGLSDAYALLGYLVFNSSAAVLSAPAGVVSDRLGRRRVLVAGYILYAGVYAALAFWSNFYTIWTIFLVYGFYEAMTQGVSRAMVSDFARPDFRATAIGVCNVVEGLGMLIASILAGLVWQFVGPEVTFTLGAALAFLAAMLFLSFRFDQKC